MHIKPTLLRHLAISAVVLAVTGWIVASEWMNVVGQGLPVPAMTSLTLWVFGICLLGWTLMSRNSIQPKPGTRPMEPIIAARTAALAMAASRMASWVGGFYVGVLIWNVTRLDTPSGAQRVVTSGLNIAATVVIIVVALWLESNCRLPEKQDDKS